MITSLVKTEIERHSSQTTAGNEPMSDERGKLLGGIWLAFFLGATVGAAMVFWFGALGLVGAAFLLLAIVIGLSVSRGRGAEEKAHRGSSSEFVDAPDLAGPRDQRRQKRFCTYRRHLQLLFLLWCGLCVFAFPAHSQTPQQEPLPGPDSHETGQGPHGHLFGDWGGERTRLQERGVKFDFQYVSDSLWNIKSEQKERLASWNRFRGTVDIDLGALIGQHGLYFHATALWQGGGNLGAYLGLLTSPVECPAQIHVVSIPGGSRNDGWMNESLRASVNSRVKISTEPSTTRRPLSSSRWAMRWAIYLTPSSPSIALDAGDGIRVVPIHNIYVKSMVLAGDPSPFSHNTTGLVPQFRGNPVSVSEMGSRRARRRHPCELLTTSMAEKDTPASISSIHPPDSLARIQYKR